MKAEETNFLKFLNSPKQMFIPIYQRAYNWKIKECKQLLNDIIRAGNDESISGHFIGSVVYVEKGLYQVSAVPKLLVIDGQQRLTTLTLLITALCKKIKASNEGTELNAERLSNYYLFNSQEEGEDKYKLILTKHDKKTLFKILDGLGLTEEDSTRIEENYKFFEEEIEKVGLEEIYKGISKLIIVDISLDREKDNPQLIFESLNSTGLELSASDLIRNYILMGLKSQEQEEIYDNYWHPMEKNFGNIEKFGLSDWFIRDFLTIKLNRIPTVKKIYEEFKGYSNKLNILELVKDMHKFSNYYVNFTLGKETDNELKKVFADINELKVDVSYPFILNIYDDYAKEVISKADFIEILRLIESYVFRRSICGIPTASLNKTFSTLYKRIDKENYVESFKATILLQDSYRKLPTDAEFKKELLIKDVYNFRNRNYLLRKIETYNRKESLDIGTYTIEHIMPQNPKLSDEWKQSLGENWELVQKDYLHTLGNLTLTGYNSEYQDKPFLVKKEMKDKSGLPIGFKDSPIRLNRELAMLETWNKDEIIKRAEKIIELAINIWLYPKIEEEILNKYDTKNSEEKKSKYTVEDHDFLKEGEPMNPLFNELRKRILNIDSSVREEPQKLYVAYKSFTNFVDIVPQKSALRLSLNIPFEKIKDVKEKCKDVTDKGRWGNGDTELKICEFDELEYALNLIRQAFNYIEGENGN
jgi:uncharacterized protein with ParB-like and HNH nuclease domain/predicted transport protein